MLDTYYPFILHNGYKVLFHEKKKNLRLELEVIKQVGFLKNTVNFQTVVADKF